MSKLKDYLGEMDKNTRSAILELERHINEVKMQTLAYVNQKAPVNYNDAPVKAELESHRSRIDALDNHLDTMSKNIAKADELYQLLKLIALGSHLSSINAELADEHDALEYFCLVRMDAKLKYRYGHLETELLQKYGIRMGKKSVEMLDDQLALLYSHSRCKQCSEFKHCSDLSNDVEIICQAPMTPDEHKESKEIGKKIKQMIYDNKTYPLVDYR